MRVTPIHAVLDVCDAALSLLAGMTQNAPFGIGMLTGSIYALFSRIKDHHSNSMSTLLLCNDVKAILDVLRVLSMSPTAIQNRVQASVENLKAAIDGATDILDAEALKREQTKCHAFDFAFSKTLKDKLDAAAKDMAVSKSTLTMAIVTAQNPQQRHVIPGCSQSNETVSSVSCKFTSDDRGDGTCMIENKTTRMRCRTIAKYRLIARANHIEYEVCGRCASQRANAWWKRAYERKPIGVVPVGIH